MARKFTKGQTVFQASTKFSSVPSYKTGTGKDLVEFRVISRLVDACGEKQVTFVDRGYDSVFGRKHSFAWSECIFATAEEAFSFLESKKNGFYADVVIYPEVVSDAEWVPSII